MGPEAKSAVGRPALSGLPTHKLRHLYAVRWIDESNAERGPRLYVKQHAAVTRARALTDHGNLAWVDTYGLTPQAIGPDLYLLAIAYGFEVDRECAMRTAGL